MKINRKIRQLNQPCQVNIRQNFVFPLNRKGWVVSQSDKTAIYGLVKSPVFLLNMQHCLLDILDKPLHVYLEGAKFKKVFQCAKNRSGISI